MKDKFLSIVLRKDGKISPNTIKEDYFIKRNIYHLWEYFINATENFNSYPISDRIFFLINDIQEPTKCKICDNLCITVNYKKGKSYSKYCSAKCSRNDKDRIKNNLKKVNHEIANERRKNTMIEKYGVEFNSQREDIKYLWKCPKIADSAFKKLNDIDWLHEQYITLNKSSKQIGDLLNCYYGTVIEYLKKHNIEISYIRSTSTIENEIKEFLESYNIIVEQSNKKIIKPKEIDLYIPDYKIGIEINGLYWHSYNYHETVIEKNKHKEKYIRCNDIGIKLIQITDSDWINKKEIVKSMLLNSIGIFNKMNARDMIIKKVDNAIYKKFVIDNHISGYATASIAYGLYYQDELYSIISFNRSRFNKNMEWEIIRFCSKINCNVRGGFSKLLKHFIKEINPKSICTYSDNRYGNGNVYRLNGFNYIRTTDVGYCWTDTKIILNRYECQKSKLGKLLNNYDSNLTESENMFNNKYRRIWDAGHNYFELYLDKLNVCNN